MGRFILRRALHGIVVVFLVSVVVFVVTRLIGDPVEVMLPIEATPEQRAEFAAQLGFDRSIPVQFLDYLGDAVRLDFGDSLWQHRPAMDIVLEHLPRTLYLLGLSIGVAIILAIPIGILASLRPGGVVDKIVTSASLVGLSIPNFWLGTMLILLVSVQLGWLPTSGAGSWRNLILPALTFALPAMARIGLMVRSSMIDELNRQYVQMARAKNISRLRIVGLHAFKNAAVPVLSLAGWELIRALAGYSVVVETVFAYPGLGFLALQTIHRQDLILLQAIVFTVAILTVTINAATDIAYTRIDPRIKLT
jgi:peptide/nickel transport system permease protein